MPGSITYLDGKLNSAADPETGTADLELSDQILQFDVSRINSPPNLYDEVYYGGIVEYYVAHNIFCCDVILHIAHGSDLGYIRLEYGFSEREYKVSNMEFSFNQVPYTVIEK